MKALWTAAIAAAAIACSIVADAQTRIGPGSLYIAQFIRVVNTTPVPVLFQRTSQRCVATSPASFVVPANGRTDIDVGWTFVDSGVDNCYAAHHNIGYIDVANPANTLRVQQYNNSSNHACVDFEYFAVFWINQAVCPEFSGQVTGPMTNSDGNGVSCPPELDSPYCPATDNGSEFFGFVVKDFVAPCLDITCVVTSAADDNGGDTLRAAMTYANNHPGTVITFAPALAGKTITLTRELPLLVGSNVTIDGGSNNITVNGANAFRAFIIGDAGLLTTGNASATITNLAITNASARGGAGGAPGGGGGAGMGGAFFVSATGILTLDNVDIVTSSATGGNGGDAANCPACGGGGGGGMGGNGGASENSNLGGGAGGGGFGNAASGGDATLSIVLEGGRLGAFSSGLPSNLYLQGGSGGGLLGGAGGAAGGGGGGGSATSDGQNVIRGGGGGGGGVDGGDGIANTTNQSAGTGGDGGFGGGGGGVGQAAASGGTGGYGGGGGGGFGNGGYGGGGGGGAGGVSGSGGFGGGRGGNVATGVGAGGGGAGMGGAIFVQHGGTLDAVGGLSIHGSTVSAGAPGATTGIAGSPGSALAPGIFLVGNGTVTMRPRAGAIQTLGDAIGDEAGTGIAPTAGAGNGPGAWALAKGGAGTLVLAAAHSHSGGTAVRAGTLLITGPGTLGAASGPLALSGGIVDLGGTTQRTGSFAQRGGTIRNGTLASSSFAMRSGVVAADLAGIGALAKTGPGTVLLSGRNTYTGGTTVRGGTLQVDGTIAGAITVDRGSLQGSGTVGDTRIDAGAALSAGDPWRRGRNAPLTIAGDLTLAAGAGYEARIAPDDAPPVRVHGTARLGGIARVTLARGGFHPERMRGHHVLLRAGALRGRFDHLAVDNLPRGLAARLRYTDTEVLLVLERE